MMLKLIVDWLFTGAFLYIVLFVLFLVTEENNSLANTKKAMTSPFSISLPFFVSFLISYAKEIHGHLHPGLGIKMIFIFIGTTFVSVSWATLFGLCPYGKDRNPFVLLEQIHKNRYIAGTLAITGVILIFFQILLDSSA